MTRSRSRPSPQARPPGRGRLAESLIDDAPEGRAPGPEHELCPGARDLIAGPARAFAVRDVIQRAIGMIIADRQTNADLAYALLRSRSAATTGTLLEVATAVVTGDGRRRVRS